MFPMELEKLGTGAAFYWFVLLETKGIERDWAQTRGFLKMFSIMTEENGEHLKKLPHLCPILCPAMGNNSHRMPHLYPNGAKTMGNKSLKSSVCAQPRNPIREFPQGFPEKRRKRYFDGRVPKNALKERVFEFCVDSLLRRNIIVLRGE